MFGGWEARFREILQNAYRAGADRVDITVSDDGLSVAIRDNGHGSAHPGLLIFAGATGWDESQVIEPGGVGLFSLLNKTAVCRVEVESRGWRVALVPGQVEAQQDIPVASGPVKDGTLIRVTLKAPIGDLKTHVQVARGYYPFTLTFNGEEIKPRPWSPHVELETPVGRVGWRANAAASKTPIWEYRPIYADMPFRDALVNAAHRHPQPKLAAALVSNGKVKWFVEPASGVRPRPPDRSALITDQALDRAAEIIVAALVEKVLDKVRPIVADWPDRLTNQQFAELPGWVKPEIRPQLLQALGWKYHRFPRPDTTYTYYVPDDGLYVENDYGETFDRRAVPVADESLATTINALNALGVLDYTACVEPDGLEVRVIGPRQPKLCKDADAPLIALCKKVALGDGRPLPLLLLDLRNDETSIVIAANAEQAVKLLLGSPMWQLICGQAVLSVNERDSGLWDRDWIDPDDDHAVDWGEVKSNLCVEITALYGRPELLAARRHYYQLQEASLRLNNLTFSLGDFRAGDRALDARFRKLKYAVTGYARRVGKAAAKAKREARL